MILDLRNHLWGGTRQDHLGTPELVPTSFRLFGSPCAARAMDGCQTSSSHEVSVEDLEQALELTDNEERSEEEQHVLEGIVNFGSEVPSRS